MILRSSWVALNAPPLWCINLIKRDFIQDKSCALNHQGDDDLPRIKGANICYELKVGSCIIQRVPFFEN